MSRANKADPGADSARGLTLLWGPRNRPGRSGLTIEAIVAAAIDIADAEGFAAVSMRNVASRLHAGAMSLYTHIPGKAELTDLMVDTVLGELYVDVDEPARQPGGWKEGMRFVAARNWDLFLRHPWLLHVVGGRPVLGPNASRNYEAELRPLDGIGLSDLEMDTTLTLILTHVEGTARGQIGMQQAQQETGMTDVEWWASISPVLARVMEGWSFPVGSRVGLAAGMAHQASANPAHALAFGLDRILDGVAVLIASRDAAIPLPGGEDLSGPGH